MQRPNVLFAAAAAASLALSAGCSQDKGDTGAEEREPTSASVETDEAAEATDDTESDEKLREFLSDPPDDAVGQVPEGHGLELGAELPDVTVYTLNGEEASLRELAGGEPVLVGFYRGGWCAYCSSQVHELAVRFDGFSSRSIKPVLISADAPEAAAETEAEYEVPFPLLSDSALAAHEAFAVVDESEGVDGEVERTGIPSLFLFDGDGKLVWQHAEKDVTVRPRAEQIFKVLDEHGFTAGT